MFCSLQEDSSDKKEWEEKKETRGKAEICKMLTFGEFR